MQFSRKARRELWLIMLFVASLPLLYLLVFGSGGFLEVSAHREQLRTLEEERDRLLEANRGMRSEIDRIKNDARELERIAREQYDLAKPGEIIIQLPSKEEPATTGKPADQGSDRRP